MDGNLSRLDGVDSDGSHLTVGLKGSLNGGHCVGVIRPDANLW